MSDRVDVDISGMNEILYGGIPKRNIVLLSGGPGTGKSIFGQQFLYAGFRLGRQQNQLKNQNFAARTYIS